MSDAVRRKFHTQALERSLVKYAQMGFLRTNFESKKVEIVKNEEEIMQLEVEKCVWLREKEADGLRNVEF